ncbi:DUF305 domain-containing protein [Nakamurella sp.]|uniref:DUF305 domain-containing protein n=1 Tax=Nakamurella sp. TaxID=1869182 RepID=UPI003B3B3059
MFKRVPGAIVALTIGLTLAACGAGTHSDPDHSAAGTIGSSPTDSSPTGAGTAGAAAPSAAGAHNAVDVVFATMMIPHHQGAVEMSDLALTQASAPQVKDLAGRIKAAQGPEIEQMQSWLTAWDAAMPMTGTGTAGPDMGHGMDHGDPASTAAADPTGDADDFGMGAMMSMSESDMAALRAATGAAFDTLFLQQMIAHHQGAIEMADVELARGENPQALALAAAIRTGQAAEITEMQRLLAAL